MQRPADGGSKLSRKTADFINEEKVPGLALNTISDARAFIRGQIRGIVKASLNKKGVEGDELRKAAVLEKSMSCVSQHLVPLLLDGSEREVEEIKQKMEEIQTHMEKMEKKAAADDRTIYALREELDEKEQMLRNGAV